MSFFLFGFGVKWTAIFSLNSTIRVQISEKKLLSLKPQPPPFLKLKKKKTDDNVENNGQVIMPGLETGTF